MVKVLNLSVPLVLILALSCTSAKKSKDEEYRLSGIIQPTHYDLNIELDPKTNLFNGRVTIHFTVNETIDYIELHASPKTLTVTKADYNFAHSCSITEPKDDTEIVSLTCNTKIKPSVAEHSVTIVFNGKYPEAPDNEYLGVYRTVYEDDTYVSTQFEPTYARRAFPCFDEPNFKSTFKLTLVHPSEYKALSNTRALNETKLEDGTISTFFDTTPEMATYTLAFLVANFKESSSNSYSALEDTFTFNVYTRPAMAQYTEVALTYGSEILSCLGKWTGKNYEEMGDTQIDQVAVVDFQYGAMENWGLIVYKEAYLLDESDNTSQQQIQQIVSTMTHELAHQWFGNLITLDWWADTWLNEGFATYCQYFIPDQLKNIQMSFESQFSVDAVQAALELDAFLSSSPLSSTDIETATQDMDKFDEISYKKGASIIRMIRSVLGDDKFHEAIKTYVKQNQYNNSNPTIVIDTFDSYFDNKNFNLKQILNNWIYKPGYPVLSVTMKDGEVIITQERFLYPIVQDNLNETSDFIAEETEWYVPISYSNSADPSFEDKIVNWLEPKKSLQIEAKDVSWVILNNQRTGFYRVNYDATLWQNIINALKGKNMSSIHVANRAQLVDDIFALARSGQVGYEHVFNLADYLKGETEYQPWSAAFKGLKFLFNKLYEDDDLVQKLRTRALSWLNKAFPTIPNNVNETHINVLRNTLVLDWKCQLEDSACLSYVNAAYEDFLNKQYIEDYNNRKIILCHGMRKSKTALKDYETLMNRYEKSELVVEKSTILSAIGCSEDSQVLDKYLSELISNDTVIRKQDVTDAYKAAYTTKAGVNRTLTFLNDHLGELIQKYDGVIEPTTYFSGLAEKITSEEKLESLSNIMDSFSGSADLDSIKTDVTSSVNVTMKWLDTHSAEIRKILGSTTNRATISLSSCFSSVILCAIALFVMNAQ